MTGFFIYIIVGFMFGLMPVVAILVVLSIILKVIRG